MPAGTFDCFLVEPQLRTPGMFIAKGKKLQVWLTADDRHMPVRMRTEVFFGHVVADLVTYHRCAAQSVFIVPLLTNGGKGYKQHL